MAGFDLKTIGTISLISLAVVGCGAVSAQAEDTISLYGNSQGWLSRIITTGQVPFEIVAVMKTSEPSSAAEFIMDELMLLVPGVFKLSTTKVNNTSLDLGDNSVGEYMMDFAGCVGAGTFEVVRVQYGDFGSAIGADVVLSIRGFGDGDSQPSGFGGEMGYVDCLDGKHVLAPEPWDDFDLFDPTRLPEVDSADGVVVLNGETPVGKSSIGILKAQF